MSKELFIIRDTGRYRDLNMTVSSFYGGKKSGKMVQITQGLGLLPDEPGFIQLTMEDLECLLNKLSELKTKMSA
uniref:Uncharacterized protein n=1 Tax=viral metagenome TaxID=1070528 RepID=A0A6M3IQM4_9ZZZZ